MRLLIIALLGIAFAACGGGDDNASQPAASDTCAGDAVTIHMKDIKFAPDKATAKTGQTICWINDDTVDHDAVAKSGATFKSELFGKGKTFTTTVDQAGTVKYECTVHPGMTGEIDVS
jgi:plastocyanin